MLHDNHYDSVSVRPGNKPSTVIENPCEAFLPNLCNFCKEEIVMESVQRQEDMVYLDRLLRIRTAVMYN
jgi:hypothetical protein